MKVADAIMEFLAAKGVEDVFTVSGGGIMYLSDALGRAGSPKFWINYHEQACAIAAEGYARFLGKPGVCLVTTGPGATNALSGIAGAWVDSIPVVVISGQVRRELIADYSLWRQLGPQEIDIVDMARPVTKLAITIGSTDEVPAAFEAAWRAATTGRPGPVWLNVPLDIQGGELPDEWPTRSAVVQADEPSSGSQSIEAVKIEQVIARLRAAERPLVLCGNGIHIAGAEAQFDAFVQRIGAPVVGTIGAMDLLGEDHPYYLGRFGPTGQRRANFAVQNADLILSLASGMSVSAVGFDSAGFAPSAVKVMVNIDGGEMTRPHLRLDERVAADVIVFMSKVLQALQPTERFEREPWTTIWRTWKSRYPVVTSDYLQDPNHVNSYYLAHALSSALGANDVVLTGNSLDAHSVFHSYQVKQGQRVMTNVNFGAMGWDLPALVGVCVARKGSRTVLVTGDGSIQFNSQELLTIGRQRLNTVIFVLNNGGYQSIRSTQQRFFEGRFVGSDPASGVGNPSFPELAQAYGLGYRHLSNNEDVDRNIAAILESDGPTICEVNVAHDQERVPRIVSRRLADGSMSSGALHDQYPFLPPEEIEEIMAVSRTPISKS